MPTYRRGFKTWCERISLGFRRDLGIGQATALPPQALAKHLGVLVWTPEEIAKTGGLEKVYLDQLLVKDRTSWSAVTLHDRGHRLVVVNSSHGAVRQNSNVMHELAHMILEHEPSRVDMTEQQLLILDSYDRNQEAEADWLSGALLVPRDPLLRVLAQDPSTPHAAERFKVSAEMISWRRQTTGIDIQLKRRTRR